MLFLNPTQIIYFWTGSKEIIFEQLAVQDAMNSFFDTTDDNLSSGPISSKEFSSKMEDTYDVIITPKNTQKPLFLGISNRFQLNNFLNPELNFKYKSGHSSYYLPAGLKPFSDPIDLKINYTSISLNAFLVYNRAIFSNLKGEIKFGIDRNFSLIKSKINSDLLSVSTNERHTISSLVFNIGLPYGSAYKITPSLDIKRYDNGKYFLSLELKFLMNSNFLKYSIIYLNISKFNIYHKDSSFDIILYLRFFK